MIIHSHLNRAIFSSKLLNKRISNILFTSVKRATILRRPMSWMGIEKHGGLIYFCFNHVGRGIHVTQLVMLRQLLVLYLAPLAITLVIFKLDSSLFV